MAATDMEFDENVLLIDVSFLNFLIHDIQNHFEPKIKRSLNMIRVDALIELLFLNAEIEKEGGAFMTILINDNESSNLYHCIPSDINKELNCVGFEDSLGKFTILSAPTTDLSTTSELQDEIIKLAIDSSKVKNLLVLPKMNEAGELLLKISDDTSNVAVTVFSLDEEKQIGKAKIVSPVISIMQSLGIMADDLEKL